MYAIQCLRRNASFSDGLFARCVRTIHGSNIAKARILATDGVDDCCVDIFQKRGHQVDLLKSLPEAELIKIIGKYDGLVVRSATKVNKNVLKHATQMKIVGRAGVGVDNIDINEATKHGVMVMNTPGGNTVSTAQLAVSLLASLARNVPAADMSVKEGKWDRKSFTGVEMAGKVLGVVGCGRIGQVVVGCAQTMGMQTIGYDPVMTAEQFAAVPGLQQVELADIWRRCDFITVHTPLTKETEGLLNDTTLAQCKKGVRIINCARGGIVDEQALLRALQSGHVAGAALDVFTTEPPGADLKPLIAHPNLICTPHLGASTEEAQVNVARDIANQMCDVLDQKDFVGIVNVNFLAASTQAHIKPFMSLAETIGAVHAQLSPSPVNRVTLKTFGGRDVNITTPAARRLLEAQVLKGLVKHNHRQGGGPELVPDLVSAGAMAASLGISSAVSEEYPTAGSGEAGSGGGSTYWNLVTVEAERADGTKCSVTGAVFGDAPHIVKVDHFADLFAFKPEGNYILSFRNQDRPGAVKEVLAILHNSSVNIASLNVARCAAGAASIDAEKGDAVTASSEVPLALCFMALDDDVPTNALAALRALPFLQDVAKIQLR